MKRPTNTRQDGIPQSFSKNFDQTGNSSGFIFDVSLSTAIAADGKVEAQAPVSNYLLSLFDHCLRSCNYVNIVTSGKQPQFQWLNRDETLSIARVVPRIRSLQATMKVGSRMSCWRASTMFRA